MPDELSGPVGLRWRTQNVANKDSDQQKVIRLLATISKDNGGKSPDWNTIPLSGGDGQCPKLLSDAIWDFQSFWKKKGVFHLIDGVVDRGMHTWQKLNQLALGGSLVNPSVQPQNDPPKLIWSPVTTIPNIWQITNIWQLAVGEIGQLGGAKVEITQPGGKKFVVRGAGAGFGVSVDPKGMLQLMKGVSEPAAKIALKPLMELLAANAAFNIGDYLQLAGVNLNQVTDGRIIVNPLNQYLGRPTAISKYNLFGASAPYPFFITSAGAGVAAGVEVGYMRMGGFPPWPDFFGFYGSSGMTAKVGAGVQGLFYSTIDVVDL